jgi:hypothetical protein
VARIGSIDEPELKMQNLSSFGKLQKRLVYFIGRSKRILSVIHFMERTELCEPSHFREFFLRVSALR